MNTNRKTAIIVGVLFIIATLFLFIGEAIYQPVLLSPDYLETAYPNRTIATLGILLEFACVLAIPLIPVFLFPILRKHNEALALGYFGFRFLEAVLFVLIQINKLSLISVSQGYLNDGGRMLPIFKTRQRHSVLELLELLVLYPIFHRGSLDALFHTLPIETGSALDFGLGIDCCCSLISRYCVGNA